MGRRGGRGGVGRPGTPQAAPVAGATASPLRLVEWVGNSPSPVGDPCIASWVVAGCRHLSRSPKSRNAALGGAGPEGRSRRTGLVRTGVTSQRPPWHSVGAPCPDAVRPDRDTALSAPGGGRGDQAVHRRQLGGPGRGGHHDSGEPGHGRSHRRGRRRRPRGRRHRRRRRPTGVLRRPLVQARPRRTLRRHLASRRPRRRPRRGARPRRVREHGQALRTAQPRRRPPVHRRQPPLLRRRRPQHARRRGGRVPPRLHVDAAARPRGGVRADRTVELPAHDGGVEDRPRARRRLHDGAEAGAEHPAHDAHARRPRP